MSEEIERKRGTGKITRENEEFADSAMAQAIARPMIGQQMVIGQKLTAFMTEGDEHTLVFENGIQLKFAATVRLERIEDQFVQ